MAAQTTNGDNLLGLFFDAGAYTPLFAREGEGVKAAYGDVGGLGAYAVLQTGAALTAEDVAASCKTLELAAKTGRPVATFYHSKGVALAGGQRVLGEMAKLSRTAAALSGVVPQVSVVYGVCGASNALAALSADLLVISKDAELFLTPPFLAAAAGDKPAGAGSAEAAKAAGVATLVEETAADAARSAARLLMLLPRNNLAATAEFEYVMPQTALDMAKYTAVAAAEAVADDGSAVELYEGFGKGVSTFLATVEGNVAGIVSTKGADAYLGSNCLAKAARFVRFCDAFSIPVVTLVNVGGVQKSSSAEAAGLLRAAARLAATYADATTAKIAVVTGRAVGAAYTALCAADLTIAVEGCVLAPVEPTAAVSVLYKEEIAAAGASIDAETAARAKKYEAEDASATAAVQAGLADMTAGAAAVRQSVADALTILATKRVQRLPKKHGNMAL